MRRSNLTISFDPAWIELLDLKRGSRSRGSFLEALSLEGGGWGFGPSYSNPEKGAPGPERSPEPPAGSEATQEPPARQGLAKPPLQRPIVQKRGK